MARLAALYPALADAPAIPDFVTKTWVELMMLSEPSSTWCAFEPRKERHVPPVSLVVVM
jgi:hypothetical protein